MTSQLTLTEAAKLRGELRHFQSHTGLGRYEIARITGMSWPGVHYILNGSRRRPQQVSAERLRTFMASYLQSHPGAATAERDDMGHALAATEATTKAAAPEDFVMTRAARTVHEVLNYCARRGHNGGIFGDPGTGKTLSLSRWSAMTRHRHVIIWCHAYTSYTRLVRAIARALGVPAGGSIDVLDDLIHDELAAHPRMLLLDEADMLSARTLDWLRTLWDRSDHRSNFVFTAKPAFYRRLQSAHARSQQDLRQIWQRLAVKQMIAGFDRDELAQVLTSRKLTGRIDADAAEALFSMSQGSFRELVMILDLVEQALEENPKLAGRITPKVVDAAYRSRFGAEFTRRRG